MSTNSFHKAHFANVEASAIRRVANNHRDTDAENIVALIVECRRLEAEKMRLEQRLVAMDQELEQQVEPVLMIGRETSVRLVGWARLVFTPREARYDRHGTGSSWLTVEGNIKEPW